MLLMNLVLFHLKNCLLIFCTGDNAGIKALNSKDSISTYFTDKQSCKYFKVIYYYEITGRKKC
jgi:hypothetical protein